MTKLPDITSNFSEWYNELVYASELADHSPVRGSLVIRPYGNAIWELMQKRLDERIKATGHQNALFPLLIPQSFLYKEAEHVQGFAPEVAVVTYAGGKELEEPYIVRPTSETIIHHMFARWIKSWRDLPLKINQWANVVRWEMRPRPFVRTTEFFWQEGHTAHETQEQAHEEVICMLNEYVEFCRDYLAIPSVAARKPAHERFPGAVETYTFESMMQDGKALQMGTSHLLSQTFAHAFDMKFQDTQGNVAYPWLTSWAVTTRLVGALIMVHGDQKGLVIPPMIAPYQVVIIPIIKKNDSESRILAAVERIKESLHHAGIRVLVDADQTKTPGTKFYEWELKGVPLRIEIGERDIEKDSVIIVNRSTGEKKSISCENSAQTIQDELRAMQNHLLRKAEDRLVQEQWQKVEKIMKETVLFEEKGGFFQTGWCTNASCVAMIKEIKGTIRCVLDERTFEQCTICDQKSEADVLIAKAY
jgi:prolyl-tRNA synthetase